jgi:hypothetical protein
MAPLSVYYLGLVRVVYPQPEKISTFKYPYRSLITYVY